MRKRLICILVFVAILFSFTACVKDSDSNKKNEIDSDNPFEKHHVVTYLTRFCHNYVEGRWDELELEEKFNIDLQVWNVDAYDTEQVMMMVAAGDWADTGYVNRFDPVAAYGEGLTRSISLDTIKNHLPEYYALLEANPIGFLFNKIEDQDDMYYGLSFSYAANNYWYNVNCFRLDWLESIGYSFNDLEEIKFQHEGLKARNTGIMYLSNRVITYDEFLDIMQQFSEGDPDKNGVDDTFGSLWPLDHPTYGSHWSDIYTGMFGFTCNNGRWGPDTWLYYDEATGNYVPSHATGMWRDFLVFISEMFKKGYMQHMPNISGTGNFTNNFYGNLNTGKYGHFPLDTLNNMNPNSPDSMYRVPGGILENNPEAKFVIVPAVLGPDGVGGNCRYVTAPFRDGMWGTWTFGSTADDEKLERILAMMRYTHFTDEGYYRYYYGIENVHYKWSGEPYNSSVITTPIDKIPLKYRSGDAIQAIFATDKFLKDFKKWSMVSDWFFQLVEYQIENEWYMKYTLEPDKLTTRLYMGNAMYKEYIDLRNEIINDVHVVADNFRDKAFKGELADINAEWSNYIDTLYRAGLDKFIEIFNREEFGKYIIDRSSLYTYE